MLPPRTYEVQVGYAIGQLGLDALVEWAINALVAGFDSPNLRVLAGLQTPLDQVEVRRLYSGAFTELGICPLPAEAHGRFHITSVLRAMLSSKLDRKEAMRQAADFDKSRDFYLLFHAKWSLELGPDQYYLPSVDRSNIDRVIDEHAKRWLDDNECDEAGWIQIAQDGSKTGIPMPNG